MSPSYGPHADRHAEPHDGPHAGPLDRPHAGPHARVSGDIPDRRSAPVRLRADGRETHRRPGTRFIATVGARPRLSWSVPAAWPGRRQCGFELRVAIDGIEPREHGAALLVHVHRESNQNALVLPLDLESHRAYSWTVRVLDESGAWSEWAEPAPLETGPLTFRDWHGRWVSHPAKTTLRASFTLEALPARARLHVTAQGLVRATVNGVAINADATDATRTDAVRALYRSYDVTDACAAGGNVLDLTLARGEWERTGRHPRVLAEIVLEQEDGERRHVGTGAGMLAAPSEVTVEEPFYLEHHEPLLASEVFSPAPELRVLAAVELPASPDDAPRDVQPDPTPALHDVLELRAAEIGRVGDARVFDVGVNVAGRTDLELVSTLAAGLTIRVVHGEHIDAAGRLDTTNLTMPFDRGRVRQAVEYVTTGMPGQRCTPWFAYHGFRYVEVQGLPDGAQVRLRVRTHHTDLPQISALTTDDGQVNRLIQRAQRTVLNNVHGVPEDCPTREQSGWTGDTAAATEFEFAAFDTEAFFRKWLADMRTSQQVDGSIPAITPDLRHERIPADPVWGAALHRVLINHWYHYGDRRVVDENLPTLRRWADFQLAARDADGIVSRAPISYGSDWLALQQTPPPIHHTAAAIDCLLVLAELEDAVGDSGAASVRRDQARELRRAARRAFVDETTGTIGNGSQGSYGCAIEAGILTDDEAERAAARIEVDVRAGGNRVSSGFATTRNVVRALARSGRSQVLFDILQQRDEPGIGAMADHGPGTLWECWWIDPQNTGTGSLDHVGLGGAFASWVWQHLAGVRPIAAGYSHVEVAPQFVSGVDSLVLDTETIRGRVHIDYRRNGERATVTVGVPVGSEAVVVLPGSAPQSAGPGVHEYDIAWPVTAPPLPAEATAPWGAPSSVQVVADVGGGTDLLATAIAQGRCGADAAHLEVLADGILCMPVPHAQVAGPVLRVTADVPAPSGPTSSGRASPSARIEFDSPLDLTCARFAYAMIDMCLDTTGRHVDTVIVLQAADGSSVEAVGRFWPAGWNRVSIDIADWPGRSSVTAIEAGIHYADDDETMTSAPVVFHLGAIGYSTLKRTW